MNYHYLMRPCIHDIAGRENIKELLSSKLPNFIDYRNIEDWFQLDKYRLSTLSDIDELFDIKTANNFEVIALYVSPYKRFFSYYLASIKTDDVLSKISVEGFSEFFYNRDELLFEGMITNLSEAYIETTDLRVKYKLEYNTLIEDLRKIPGLESVPDDFISEQRQLMDQYKSFYTEEIKEWVDATFAKDIQTYGYTF